MMEVWKTCDDEETGEKMITRNERIAMILYLDEERIRS